MPFNIDQFKAHLNKGGARPSMFEVLIQTPPAQAPQIPADTRFFVEAASLPSSQVGLIQVPYFGRFIKLAGDRQFEPWLVSIINDEDFKVRNALEAWSSRINNLQDNVRTYANERDYKSSAIITQYSKDGKKIRAYQFEGLFPQQIAAIDMNWGSVDQIERFQVTFEYDYYTVLDVGKVDRTLIGSNRSFPTT